MRTAIALADGFVPVAKTAIVTCPANTKYYLSEMTFHNVNAVVQTLIIYVNRSGTSRIIGRASLTQNYTLVGGAGTILEAGDTLEVQTTTANAVHYTVSGVAET